MKRILMIVCIFACLMSVAFSETVPDGRLFDAYEVHYESAVIDGFQKIWYLEPEGLLFSAYGADTEITVSIENNEKAADAKEFLDSYRENISKYAKILEAEELGVWESPLNTEGTGMRIKYMYNRASSEADAFCKSVFASRTDDGKFLVCTFGASAKEDAVNALNETEKEFLRQFSLEKRHVSSQYMAYLKSAEEKDGKTFVTVDYCSVEYDASIFTIYASNEILKTYEYALHESAYVWTPDLNASLYSAKQTEPDISHIAEAIKEYKNQRDSDAIYRILLNEENEIIWMMHYNAF